MLSLNGRSNEALGLHLRMVVLLLVDMKGCNLKRFSSLTLGNRHLILSHVLLRQLRGCSLGEERSGPF